MERRKFMKQSLFGAGAFIPFANQLSPIEKKIIQEDAKPFKCDYGFHDGTFKNLAGADFIEQIKFGYSQGFRSIEDNGMMGRSAEQQQKIGDTLAKLGMRMGVFVISYASNDTLGLTTGKKEWMDKFSNTCKEAVEVAKRTNAKYMTVVPGSFDRSKAMGYQTSNVVEAMRRGAEIFEKHNLIMVMEPLSDSPNLFLRFSDQTFEICRAVNSPSCKILFDMYHMQKNEGNIINNINSSWDEIAYFQIGNNPGRKEPGTGEMDYKNILKHIYDKGYRGILGMEHGMAGKEKEGELALIKNYREADSF